MTRRPMQARLGMAGHAAVLARLKDSPATFDDLWDEGLIGSHSNGYRLLASLHRLLRIHISGWREEPYRSLRAEWTYGFGEDAPMPARRGTRKQRRAQPGYLPTVQCIPPSYLALDMLLTELEAPHTKIELADLTGLDQRTVRGALRGLGKLVGKVGRRDRSDLWQLRESMAPRNSRAAVGAAFRSAPSVFRLGVALRKELQEA